jgi:DNA-directed RNA polymerase III subunit RPC4
MPSSLPLPQQPQSVAEPDKGPEENAEPVSTSTKERRQFRMPSSVQGTKLEDMPGGLMGKILVYASGKVKMKNGDALYNVSIPNKIKSLRCSVFFYFDFDAMLKSSRLIVQVSVGSNCMFVQEVAAMNTREKHCCTLGEISKRAVVTPDIDYLLGSVDKMDE